MKETASLYSSTIENTGGGRERKREKGRREREKSYNTNIRDMKKGQLGSI